MPASTTSRRIACYSNNINNNNNAFQLMMSLVRAGQVLSFQSIACCEFHQHMQINQGKPSPDSMMIFALKVNAFSPEFLQQ